MQRTSKRLLPPLLALAILAGLGPSALPAQVLEDLRGLDDLRKRFNASIGSPRLVLLLSPTCPVCVRGAKWVQQSLLEAHPQQDLRVYAIWFTMVRGDDRSRWPAQVLDDPRVVHLWDGQRAVGRWYASYPQSRSGSEIDDGVAWDTYFLYGPDASWHEAPSAFVGHGSTIIESKERLRQNLEALWLRGATGVSNSSLAGGHYLGREDHTDACLYDGAHLGHETQCDCHRTHRLNRPRRYFACSHNHDTSGPG